MVNYLVVISLPYGTPRFTLGLFVKIRIKKQGGGLLTPNSPPALANPSLRIIIKIRIKSGFAKAPPPLFTLSLILRVQIILSKKAGVC